MLLAEGEFPEEGGDVDVGFEVGLAVGAGGPDIGAPAQTVARAIQGISLPFQILNGCLIGRQ